MVIDPPTWMTTPSLPRNLAAIFFIGVAYSQASAIGSVSAGWAASWLEIARQSNADAWFVGMKRRGMVFLLTRASRPKTKTKAASSRRTPDLQGRRGVAMISSDRNATRISNEGFLSHESRLAIPL